VKGEGKGEAWLENTSGASVVGEPGVPASIPLRVPAPPAAPSIIIGRSGPSADVYASPPPPTACDLAGQRANRSRWGVRQGSRLTRACRLVVWWQMGGLASVPAYRVEASRRADLRRRG
jgi:hypothetical protein